MAAVRTMMAAAALGLGVMAWNAAPAVAAEPSPVEAVVSQQLAEAASRYQDDAFDAAARALVPALAPDVFDALSDGEQYQVLGLYARALYRLGAFDDAHAALVDLTENPDATPADWALRLDTAQRIGDEEDAALAQDQLEDADSPEDDNPSIAA